MYSIEEAEKDFQEAEEARPDQVVNRLPSFKAPLGLKNMRQPSFFQKMFTSTKLNRVHSEYIAFPESEIKNVKEYMQDADGEETNSGKKGKKSKTSAQGESDKDADPSGIPAEGRGKQEDDDELKEDSSSPRQAKSKQRNRGDPSLAEIAEEEEGGSLDYEDGYDQDHDVENESDYPLMPRLGKPVNIDRLVNRTKAAASGIRYLMEMMENDTAQSVKRARAIPVSKELDRVQVTPSISAEAAKVRSTAQIKESVKGNMNEIQRNLNYRKSALIMMNVNYSNQRVRKIDPIYVQEARSIITYK